MNPLNRLHYPFIIVLMSGFHHVPVACGEMPLVGPPSATPATEQMLVSAPRVVWHNDFDAGWAESVRRNIPMVIYITTDRCVYCDAMKRDTWCDKTVMNEMAGDFVAITLSPAANAETLDRIRVKTYPTTLIGLPQGKIVEHRGGYQPAADMKALLRTVKMKVRGH